MTAADQSAATEVTKANLVKCLTRLLAQKVQNFVDFVGVFVKVKLLERKGQLACVNVVVKWCFWETYYVNARH